MENRDVLIKALASVSDIKYLSSFLKREFNSSAISDYSLEEFKDDCLFNLSGIQSLLDNNTKMRTRAALDIIHRIDNKIGEFAATKTEYAQEEKHKIKTDYLKRIADKKLGSCYLTTQDNKFNHRFYQGDIDILKEAINNIIISEQNTASSSLKQNLLSNLEVNHACKYYALAYILEMVSKGLEVHSTKKKMMMRIGKDYTKEKFDGDSFYKDVKKYYEDGTYKNLKKILDNTLPNWRTIVVEISSNPESLKTYIKENY